MDVQQTRELIVKELPAIIRQDKGLKEWILNLSSQQFADKLETESRFNQMMRIFQQKIEEERQAREEQQREWQRQARQWEENHQRWQANEQANQRRWEANERRWEAWRQEAEAQRKENQQKWDDMKRELEAQRKENQQKWEANEQRWQAAKQEAEAQRKENQQKWEANQKVINEMLESIKRLDKKYDQTIGALGTRWGLHSEEAFRNALCGILQEFPSGVEVVHVNEFDDAGEVFGRPDQVELDLIIRNGTLLIAEIKSSVSRGEVYLFERKARFYEKRHQQTAHKLIVISPMVDKRAKEVAKKLGITIYSYTDEVEFT